jgi:bile acid:Na+ symporter, BASS family
MQIVTISLIVALIVVKFGLGLDITPGDLRFFRERRGLMVRSFLAVIVLVPITSLAVILLIRPSQPVSVAIALLAASPASPLALAQVGKSRGHVPYAANVQLYSAILSVVTTPLILMLLSAALGFEANLNPLKVAWQVSTAQLIPIGLGVLARAVFPRLEKPGRVAAKVATFVFLALMLLVIFMIRQGFAQMGLGSYLAVAASVAAAIIIGHLLAPRETGMKVALAWETALRNPGLAMLIATANFPTAKPLPILGPCVIVTVVICMFYAKVLNRPEK